MAPARARGSKAKVAKTAAADARRPRSPLPNTAQEQLQTFVQEAKRNGTVYDFNVFGTDGSNIGYAPSLNGTQTHAISNGVYPIALDPSLYQNPALERSANSSFSLDDPNEQTAYPDSPSSSASFEPSDESHSCPSSGVPKPTTPSQSARSSLFPQPQNSPENDGKPLTAIDVAVAWYGPRFKADSTLCRTLVGMPAKREPHQRKREQKLNLERRGNVEALLAQIAGGPPERGPCKSCQKGHGPWTTCVVKEGDFLGSCANCWFNASGSRCTFHENNNHQPSYNNQTAAPILAAAPQLMAYQPASILTQLPHPQQTATSQIPTMASDLHQGQLADPTSSHLVSDALGACATFSKRDRLIARIQAAAKELGIRMAEFEDYLRTPEGMAEEQRAQQVQAQQQRLQPSSDEACPNRDEPHT